MNQREKMLTVLLIAAGIVGLIATVSLAGLFYWLSPRLDDPVHFVDHAASYKGKRLTLALRVARGNSPPNSHAWRLEQSKGHYVLFNTLPDSRVHADVFVLIPENLNVPNAGPGEDVIVTFDCNLGKIGDGNEAVKITRR